MTSDLKEIYASYNSNTIRVYQAFTHRIADEVLMLGTFGTSFKLERMTWIKSSFLWMMYRSGWGTKENQERVLAIDILKDGFNEILSQVVLSTYNSNLYSSYNDWKKKMGGAEVRCQWDPDRDINGNPINRRAIQLGLKGTTVKKYTSKWIYKITDISDDVHRWGIRVKEGYFCARSLPEEKIYPLDEQMRKILGM